MLNHQVHEVRKPNHSSEFRRCLVDCDIPGIIKLWKHVSPNMPCPETDEDALICIHMTRTATERLPFRFRAYSHRWLTERMLRSLLPDDLKPKAERLYPRIVSAVGICVSGLNNRKSGYHHAVNKALCDLVADMYAHGIEDPERIKLAMKQVHDGMRNQK